MEANEKKSNQLDSVIFLRGLAVIMVCFCHFGNALSGNHYFEGVFKLFHEYGGIWGIHIFFVISGFIIPYSLWRGRYSLTDYFRFLYKRVLRLHPPYLAALTTTLIIMFFSYRVRHVPFPEGGLSILKSIFYVHIPYDNPVFWSLAIEAQFYLFIGVFFILLTRHLHWTVLIVVPVLLWAGQSKASVYVGLLSYLPFFLIGTFAFLLYKDEDNWRWLPLISLVGLIFFSFFFYNFSVVAMSAMTVFVIFLMRKWRIRFSSITMFPGKISYSIYLIHFPIGVKFINVVKQHVHPGYSWVLFLLTLVIVFFISWLFYLLFEAFSEGVSKRIKYTAG